jgi:hypothetical protein
LRQFFLSSKTFYPVMPQLYEANNWRITPAHGFFEGEHIDRRSSMSGQFSQFDESDVESDEEPRIDYLRIALSGDDEAGSSSRCRHGIIQDPEDEIPTCEMCLREGIARMIGASIF